VSRYLLKLDRGRDRCYNKANNVFGDWYICYWKYISVFFYITPYGGDWCLVNRQINFPNFWLHYLYKKDWYVSIHTLDPLQYALHYPQGDWNNERLHKRVKYSTTLPLAAGDWYDRQSTIPSTRMIVYPTADGLWQKCQVSVIFSYPDKEDIWTICK